MSELIIDDNRVADDLATAAGPVELCTRDGRRLGLFTPTLRQNLAHIPLLISEEELSRRERDTTCATYTTTEVLAKLKGV